MATRVRKFIPKSRTASPAVIRSEFIAAILNGRIKPKKMIETRVNGNLQIEWEEEF